MSLDMVTISGHKVVFIRTFISERDLLDLRQRAIRDGIIPKEAENEPVKPHWTYAWKVIINGQQYGDWIKLTDVLSNTLDDPIIAEARQVLIEQARQVIKKLKRETHASSQR